MGGRAAVVIGAALSAGILVLYLGLIALVFSVRFGVNTSLPWWIAVAAPVALYAVLVPFSLSRTSAGVQLTVLGVLGVGYAVLAVITAAVVAAVTGLDFLPALGQSSLRFMPAPLLQLFVLPMALLPLRSLVEAPRHPQRRRSDRQPGNWDRRREAVPGWDHRQIAGLAPDESPDLEAAPEAEEADAAVAAPRAVEAAPAVRETPAAPVVAARREPEADEPTGVSAVHAAASAAAHAAGAVHTAAHARAEAPALAADTVSAVSAVTTTEPPPAASQATARTGEAPVAPVPAPAPVKTIAISFARVAETLPADFFAVPHHVLGAKLSEPGKLLVPVDVVVPQLAEGLVSVAWNDVAAQFPREALGPNAAAMMERLSDGRLMLPLDEIVRALPPELFALSTPTVDLAGIESFPLPFQPRDGSGAPSVPPASGPEPVVEHAKAAEPSAVVAEAAPGEVPEPVKAVEPVVAEAAPGEVPEPVKVVEPVVAELPLTRVAEPVVEKAAEPAETAPASFVAPAPVVAATAGVPGPEPWAKPVVDGFAAAVSSNGPATVSPLAASVPAPADGRLESLAVALSPLGTLIASLEEHEGRRLYVFRPPLVTRSDVMDAAGPALAFLDRASGHVEQLTVRFATGAVTLTPIADDPAGATLVVASAQGDGSLALLEIASLRECGRKDRKVSPPSFTSGPGEDLTPVPGGPAADLIAGTIGAFGAFTPSVLRDPDRQVELCLLTASGDDARTFGPIAHAACRALETGPAGGFQSAVLRMGPRRLAVRPVAGRPGHWIALVTTGQNAARPGRVELEMTRAASRVGAR